MKTKSDMLSYIHILLATIYGVQRLTDEQYAEVKRAANILHMVYTKTQEEKP